MIPALQEKIGRIHQNYLVALKTKVHVQTHKHTQVKKQEKEDLNIC